MVSIPDFLSKDKSMIIAPAGYGKTHTIVDCIEQYEGEKRILVLTHTHAGIASIKDKIKKRNIIGTKYHIDTICSFALNMANNYHINKSDFPQVEDSRTYFDFAIASSTKSLKNNAVKSVIRSKYSHLIVDEYQDCSMEQHNLILGLSSVLKTHILGDPLQGIFNFRGTTLVNMEEEDSLSDYRDHVQELTTPWRWNNNNVSALGSNIADIRRKLIANESIDMDEYEAIETIVAPSLDIHQQGSAYKNRVWREVNYGSSNLLIIHPISSSDAPRVKILQYFSTVKMVESIDSRHFYDICKEFDDKSGNDLIGSIITFVCKFSNKSKVEGWVRCTNENWTTKNKKRSGPDAVTISSDIQSTINSILENKSNTSISLLINKLLSVPNNRFRRREIVFDVLRALKEADLHKISVYEAMKQHRDKVRRSGRKIFGKCIGTTLLTKGLECDTVIVLDAHKFEDKKNLYVALTRACKKLIVFTENKVLGSY